MDLRPLGNSGLYVTELCLGVMTFGMDGAEDVKAKVLDTYLDAGGNFIDTADTYGRGVSEEILGRLIKSRGIRDKLVIATKVRAPMSDSPIDRGLSRRHIMDGVDASLKRLQTDYIDLYQTHFWDEFTPIEETMSALDAIVRAGKVRYVGASNVAGWQLSKANGIAEREGTIRYTCLQPEYSLISRDIERELIPACLDGGIGVIPYSPLGGGLLSGKYSFGQDPPSGSRGERAAQTGMAAQWQSRMSERNFKILDTLKEVAGEAGKSLTQVALRWIADKPGVTAPIVGASSPEQLSENLGAIGWKLDDAQRTKLDEASAVDLGYPYALIKTLNQRTSPLAVAQ